MPGRKKPSANSALNLRKWTLKFVEPESQKSLLVNFVLLQSVNGFQRVASASAVFAHRNPSSKEVAKIAVKQTYDLRTASVPREGTAFPLKVGDCELTESSLKGSIQSKGRDLRFDLSLSSLLPDRFSAVPERLKRSGILRNTYQTLSEDLRAHGMIEVDGEKHQFDAAPGSVSLSEGFKSFRTWTWGQCNTFTDESGKPASFVFEGIDYCAPVFGVIPSPRLSCFFFHYQGRSYQFDSIMDAFRSRSVREQNEWKFQVERGDLVFRGMAKAEHRDFSGFAFEDTDGSLIYCANSALADLKIWVYRRGKLEATLVAQNNACLEIAERTPNPYVPLLF